MERLGTATALNDWRYFSEVNLCPIMLTTNKWFKLQETKIRLLYINNNDTFKLNPMLKLKEINTTRTMIFYLNLLKDSLPMQYNIAIVNIKLENRLSTLRKHKSVKYKIYYNLTLTLFLIEYLLTLYLGFISRMHIFTRVFIRLQYSQ